MTKHWTQPQGDDLTFLAAVGAITDPIEMLECMIENAGMIGIDPYYRAIDTVIWKAAERVAAAERRSGFVITANDSVEAICLGTEDEAEVVMQQLKDAHTEQQRKAYGDLAMRHRAKIHWAVRQKPIL